jgi:chromosome partitioning protein
MSKLLGSASEKKISSFRDSEFHIAQLSEMTGVSRPVLYSLEKTKLIIGRQVRTGASFKKLYNWEDVERLAQRSADKKKLTVENKIKVFANLKGGVGKSSISSQVAMRASGMGLKTLLIDLDPQAHASLALGFDNLDETVPTILNCLFGNDKLPLTQVIQKVTPLLSVVPASLALSSIEVKLQQDYKGAEKLRKLLTHEKKSWDLIIVDTNPSASLLNVNALIAADEICVVSATDFLSVSGLRQLFSILDDLAEDFDDFQPIIRIIPNLFDVREAICQEALGVLRQKYGEFLTTTVVRKNVDMKEAQKSSQAVWLYNKRSTAAEDIANLTNELIGVAEVTK